MADTNLETIESEGLAVRRNRRAKLDLYVNKIVGDEPHMARVRDISATGVYLYKLIEPESLPRRIGLELQLPNTDDEGEVIWAVGEVVREEERGVTDGVAVKFVRIAESDRQRIVEYVDDTRV
jgi:c-di-GMP-binding flagellar brake protein YcgR